MEIRIIKRDSTSEPFNADKIITAIAKSGVPLPKSEEVAESIENWIKSEKSDGVIFSTEIRDKIIELLQDEFPAEVESFKVFKKA